MKSFPGFFFRHLLAFNVNDPKTIYSLTMVY